MLKIEDLTFSYQTETIFESTSFVAYDNQMTVIMAGSGVGKTTLLDIISLKHGVFFKYHYNDKDISDTVNMNAFINNLYYVNQEPIFPNDLTIQQQWDLLEKIYKPTISISSYIQTLKIDHITKLYPKQLSGGEKLRVALINALICQPKILLVDEPTASLNDELKEAVIRILEDYKKNHIIIVSTHDMKFINACDTLYKIENSKLIIDKNHLMVQEGSNHHIQKNSIHWFSVFFKMKGHHFLKQSLKSMCLGVIVAFCAFTAFMDNEIIGEYKDTLTTLESNRILVYKALESSYPAYGDDNSNLPLNNDELSLIQTIKYVKNTTPKIIVSLYNFDMNTFENVVPTFEIKKQDSLLYNSDNPENIPPLFVETINSPKDYGDKIKSFSNREDGIYINKQLIESLGLQEKDLQDTEVTMSLAIPVYDLAGFSSKCFGSCDENSTGIPCNTIVPVNVEVTIPIIGSVDGILFDAVSPSTQQMFIPTNTLLSIIEEFQVESGYTTYYKNTEVTKNPSEATETLAYTPWQPSAVTVEIESVDHVEEVVNTIKKYGFSVDWQYFDYASSTNSIIQTKSFLQLISITLLIFIVSLLSGLQFIKNKEEHIFNKWLQQIGFFQRFEILKIKTQKHCIDTILIFIISLVMLKITSIIILKSMFIKYEITLPMALLSLLVCILTQLIVPIVWEVFDYARD